MRARLKRLGSAAGRAGVAAIAAAMLTASVAPAAPRPLCPRELRLADASRVVSIASPAEVLASITRAIPARDPRATATQPLHAVAASGVARTTMPVAHLVRTPPSPSRSASFAPRASRTRGQPIAG